MGVPSFARAHLGGLRHREEGVSELNLAGTPRSPAKTPRLAQVHSKGQGPCYPPHDSTLVGPSPLGPSPWAPQVSQGPLPPVHVPCVLSLCPRPTASGILLLRSLGVPSPGALCVMRDMHPDIRLPCSWALGPACPESPLRSPVCQHRLRDFIYITANSHNPTVSILSPFHRRGKGSPEK